jgi:hypothetical protein
MFTMTPSKTRTAYRGVLLFWYANPTLIVQETALIYSTEAGILVYEPVLTIDPYQRKAWNSAKEIERRF